MVLQSPRIRRAARPAFTLLEVLVVVAIILVLAGVGIFALMPNYERAKEDLAKAKMKSLSQACQAYKLRYDAYPPMLAQLIQPPDGEPLVKPDAIIDPWGQEYQYNPEGTNNGGYEPDIWVVRPNKQIGNWTTK